MRVKIEADSQEEYELKKAALLEKIAGPAYEVRLKKKGQSLVNEPRPAHYQAQKEMLEYWNARFREVIEEIKDEVSNAINE